MVFKFFVVGGYKGNKAKYGERITPYFDTYLEALHYQQTYRCLSESLCKGTIEKELVDDESI